MKGAILGLFQSLTHGRIMWGVVSETEDHLYCTPMSFGDNRNEMALSDMAIHSQSGRWYTARCRIIAKIKKERLKDIEVIDRMELGGPGRIAGINERDSVQDYSYTREAWAYINEAEDWYKEFQNQLQEAAKGLEDQE